MKEYAEPLGDWVLCRVMDHEERTKSGLVLASPGDYDHLKSDRERKAHVPDRDIKRNDSQELARVEVLAVGPGQPIDVASDHSGEVFARKPMESKVGCVVLVQKRNLVKVLVSGEVLGAFHDFAAMALITQGPTGNDVIDPKHDYVFSRPADTGAMQVSAGGIAMPELRDPTGVREALPDRWEVMGVGEGAWALRFDRGKAPTFERRGSPVQIGDVFLFEGSGLFAHIAGAPILITQAFQSAFLIRPMPEAQA